MKRKTISLLIIVIILLTTFITINYDITIAEGIPYAVAAGGKHSVVLKSDGTVWAWGDNVFGQLGDGTNVNKPKHTLVKDMMDVTSIASGNNHTLALKKDGTVWAWGANYCAQLGNGTKNDSNIPVKVKIDNIKYIYASDDRSWAIKSDGTIWNWGLAAKDADEKMLVPQEITKVTDAKTVCSEGDYTIVLKENGTVWAWGSNKFGQLGDGTNNDREEASQISGLSDVKAIAAKGNRCIALKSDGSVWVWGKDLSSVLVYYGNGLQSTRATIMPNGEIRTSIDGMDTSQPETLSNIYVPTKVDELKEVVAVTAGLGHYAVAKSDGTVWAWGNNNFSQLGDEFKGTRYSKVTTVTRQNDGYQITTKNEETETKAKHDIRKTPVQVNGVSGIITITSGKDYNLAVKSDGSVWAWGDNSAFKLGYRTSELVGQVLDLKLFDHLPTITPTVCPTDTPTPTQHPKNEIILQIDNKIMTINGIQKEIDPGIGTTPIIENGSTLLPIRALIEAMGGTVDWSVEENNEMHIVIKANSKDVTLVIGKNITFVNGEEKAIGTAPKIIKGRTMIPLRYVIENLGYEVNWDKFNKKITVSF